MIPYSLLLVTLLPGIVASSSPPATSMDWAECNAKEAKCVVIPECVGSTGDGKEVLLPRTNEVIQPDCAIGVSLRAFTDKLWWLRVQIAASEFDQAEGIRLFVGAEELLRCSTDAQGGVKLTAKVELNADLFGTGSQITTDGVFCSVLVNDASSLPSLTDAFKIAHKTTSGSTIELSGPTSFFSRINKDFISCNPFSLTSNLANPLIGYKKQKIPDILSKKFECTGPPGTKIFVGSAEATNFECDKSKNKYTYNKNGESEKVEFDNEEMFCGIPIETTCGSLPTSDEKSPTIETSPTTSERVLKCPNANDKLLIDGRFYTTAPKCKNSVKHPNAGAWFAHNGQKDVEFRSAECTNKMKCGIVSKLDHSTPKIVDKIIETAQIIEDDIFCTDAEFHLEVNEPGSLKVFITNVTCDYGTGAYRTDDQVVINNGAKVYCAQDILPPVEQPLVSISFIIISVVSIITSVAITIVFAIVVMPRLEKKKRQKREDIAAAAALATKAEPDKTDLTRWQHLFFRFDEPMAYEPRSNNWKEPFINLKKKLAYIDIILGQIRDYPQINIHKFMNLLEVMFTSETDLNVWLAVLPFLFRLERWFFHSQLDEKIIPHSCYDDFRSFLIKLAENAHEQYGMHKKDGKFRYKGFVCGVAFLLLYKLNVMNDKARKEIVKMAKELFKHNWFYHTDPSAAFIWGILHIEESHWQRIPGEHLKFTDRPAKHKDMADILLSQFEVFLQELKNNTERRTDKVGGDFMQLLLFAMGCTVGRTATKRVMERMQQNPTLFGTEDFMYLMWGRDWMWDGAWASIFKQPAEHDIYCELFTQFNIEYYDLAEMCVGYWADKHSDLAKQGFNFEGYMLRFNVNFEYDGKGIKRIYKYNDRFQAALPQLGKDMANWLNPENVKARAELWERDREPTNEEIEATMPEDVKKERDLKKAMDEALAASARPSSSRRSGQGPPSSSKARPSASGRSPQSNSSHSQPPGQPAAPKGPAP